MASDIIARMGRGRKRWRVFAVTSVVAGTALGCAGAAGATAVAVDDAGRGVAAVTTPRGVELVRVVGRRRGATTVVAGLGGAPLVGVARGGTVVGAATRAEVVPDGGDDPHAAECCAVPVVFRWGGGAAAAAPATRDAAPAVAGEYDLDAFAVRPDGDAVVGATDEGDDVGNGPSVVARVPVADAAPIVQRATPAGATDVLVAPGGSSAAWRVFDQDPRFARVDGGLADLAPVRSPWRFDEQVALDGRGRVVRAAVSQARRLTVTRAGGAERAVATLRGSGDVWRLATGADGTAAVGWEASGRLRALVLGERRSVAFGAARRGAAFALAVDGRGGVHAAWETPGGAVVVRGPATGRARRVASHGSVSALAVSPRGAEIVAWAGGGVRTFSAAR